VRPDDPPDSPHPNPPLPGLDPRITGEGREHASFEIDAAAPAPPESGRAEPILAVPAPAELEEIGRLDPDRATLEREPPPLRRHLGLSLAMLGSLGVHLLPLLLLLDWTFTPAEIAAPIPVQLVIEEPPPPPPSKPEEFKPPPPGRLASEDIGQTASPPPEAGAAPPAPSEPAPTQLAAVIPPRPSQPTPTQMAAAVPPPKPIRPPKPAAPGFTWHRLDILPQAAPRETRVPGTAATRDEYLAYCMVLIRRHFGLLSPAFLGGRRGAAAFKLLVLDDGRIARITIMQGSPYPDIDARIEEAVTAVRRFPPLPQWLQGSSAGLILQVIYPDGL
jgi:TonB-like protein